MKYSILIVAFLGMSVQGFSQADAITKYFNQYVEDTSFTVVYISPKMFEMISKLAEDEMEPEIEQIIRDLKGLRVLTTERNGMRYYKEAMNKINVNEYEELMTVRDGDQNVRFVIKEKNDVIEELLLLVGAPDQFVMISFVGKINLDKISKLAKAGNIDGLEHLEKIGN
jgi:hypothetical protein